MDPRRTYLILIAVFLFGGSMRAQERETRDSTATHVERTRTELLPLPIVFYTPETGWAGGVSVLYVTKGRRGEQNSRPSTEAVAAIYTERKQFLLELGGEWYLSDGLYKAEHDITAERFPAYFYGIGSRSPESAKEAFTLEHRTFDATGNRRLSGELSAGVVIHWENVRMLDRTPGSLLASGMVPGGDGGTVSALGVQMLWDTRDHIFSASSGRFHTLSVIFAGRTLGSDFSFAKLKVDLREYVPLGPEQCLALQGMGVFIGGTAPFRELGRLGGSSTLRGYYEGRYRDKDMLVAQAEFRTAVTGRFGAVAFAGAGTVARAFSTFELQTVRPSAGVGVRFAFDPEERLNVRLDVGWGSHSSGVYIVASEAF